jgi:hypothetical protein
LQVAVHVSRAGHRQQAALSLAHRAAVVIAEEPFCAPWFAGCRALCGSKSFAAPVWLVDADSIVPCSLVHPSSCHKAYKYEAATSAAATARLAAPWADAVLHSTQALVCGDGCDAAKAFAADAPDSSVAAAASAPIPLPFQPVLDLSAGSIVRLVAEMDAIDHAVPAVLHTLGGAAEGYRRWAAFVARGGLGSYAKRRNDALDPAGVSRMSAYLNLGMVSPLRIGREVRAAARRKGTPGAAKFTAEFETWRGLSYAFCYHHTPPGAVGATLAMLPAWAQATLAKHATDRRPQLVPLADLARGLSGDAVWDALQVSLVTTGELHNNARMGWGKAVLAWCAGPQECLATLVALNDTFALDGHSPPSLGGVMGCLGLFESPKVEGAVYGAVQRRGLKRRYAEIVGVKAKDGGQRPFEFTKSTSSAISKRDSDPPKPFYAYIQGS